MQYPVLKTWLATSRADPQHRRYEYTSEDAEGEGWRYEVHAGWFRDFVRNSEGASRLGLYEEQLREVERLISRTSPNGKVEMEWTVSILLATKK